MRKIILSLAIFGAITIALWFISSCAVNVTVGSGNVITQSRHVSDFTSLDVEKAFNVVLIQGDSNSVTIQADDNFLPYVKTEVKGGELKISNDGNFASIKLLKVMVTFKKLDEIEAIGAVNFISDSNTLRFEDLKIKITGASDLSMKLQAKNLSVKTEGASKVNLSGNCDKQDIKITGAGSYKAYDLISNEAHIDISGAGVAYLNVASKLTASCTGASVIRYKGEPGEKHFDSSGASSIKPEAN